MSRELIFHIGHHKTGSSTIQDAFALNHVDVQGKEVMYLGRMAHNYLAQHFKAYLKTGEVLQGDDNRPNLNDIRSRLASGSYDFAVFSAEEFEGFNPKGFHRVLSDFMLPHVNSYKVICYVRPHVARTVSSFVEQTKLGLIQETLSEFHEKMMRTQRFVYDDRLASWNKVFSDKFIPRTMVRDCLQDGSVLTDFITQSFGADSAYIQGMEVVSNESLSLEDLVVLRYIQSKISPLHARFPHHFGWHMANAMRKNTHKGPTTKIQIDRHTAESAHKFYTSDAKSLDAGLLRSTPVMIRELEKAVHDAVAEPQSLEISDHYSPDLIRTFDLMIETIDFMLQQKDKKQTWGTIFHQKRIQDLHGEMIENKRHPTEIARQSNAGGALRNNGKSKKSMDSHIFEQISRDANVSYDSRNEISKRVNNIFIRLKPKDVVITCGDILSEIVRGVVTKDAKSVLEELYTNMFFWQHSEAIKKRTPFLSFGAHRAYKKDLLSKDELSPQGVGVLQGGSNYLKGSYEAAYQYFDAARLSLTENGERRHHNQGLLSLRDFKKIRAWAYAKENTPSSRNPTLLGSADFGDDNRLIVVSMDGKYFEKYGQRLIDTAAGISNLHFHIVNPDGVILLEADHVRYSVEQIANPKTAYYATARFLHARCFLEHYKRPFLIADADSFVVGSSQPVFEQASGLDILMTSKTDGDRGYRAAMPWRRIMAGLCVVQDTQGALEFLTLYERIYDALAIDDPSGPYWWVDQAILAMVSDLSEADGLGVKLGFGWLFPLSGLKQDKI